jgi:hypothetical protein
LVVVVEIEEEEGGLDRSMELMDMLKNGFLEELEVGVNAVTDDDEAPPRLRGTEAGERLKKPLRLEVEIAEDKLLDLD